MNSTDVGGLNPYMVNKVKPALVKSAFLPIINLLIVAIFVHMSPKRTVVSLMSVLLQMRNMAVEETPTYRCGIWP